MDIDLRRIRESCMNAGTRVGVLHAQYRRAQSFAPGKQPTYKRRMMRTKCLSGLFRSPPHEGEIRSRCLAVNRGKVVRIPLLTSL